MPTGCPKSRPRSRFPISGAAARGAAANAQALNQVALKAVQDHGDLMVGRGWNALRSYVAAARPAP